MKVKIIQFLVVLLLSLTILLIVIGLILIHFSSFHFYINNHLQYVNGFTILKRFRLSFILKHSADYFYNFGHHHFKENLLPWMQLKAGVIFCVILVPIFASITMSLFSLIVGLKIKIRNNNFWDAIKNCEVISNYYLHFKTISYPLSYLK